MVEAFSICGLSKYCVEKIDKLMKVGVSQIVVGSPIGPNMRKSINMIATELFPNFKKDGE
jgi:5,10-methylenetetrahydromethanopterin reductase